MGRMPFRKAMLAWLFLGCATPAWAARDLCELLKDKGILSDLEYKECKAAQEKEAAADTRPTKLPAWLNHFTPFGDLRLRDEMFLGSDFHFRNRGRLRARLGLAVTPVDEVSATFRVATGSPDDPISSNQSFEKTFTRKPFSLDQAYLLLKPGKTFGIRPGSVSVSVGKFAANAYRVTEMLFDDDLNPEGMTEILSLVEEKEGTLRGLRVSGFQWVMDEVSTGSDAWMGGGQIGCDLALGSAANWTLAAGDYSFQGLNSLARRRLSPTIPNARNPTDPAINTMRNTQLANSNSVVLDPYGSILGFKDGFNVLHVASEMNFEDPIGLGVPGGLFGEFVHNTQADGRNVGFALGAGFGRAGRDWYRNPLKNPGDWSASYTFQRVEKDAAVSLYSYSDIDFSTRDSSGSNTQKGSTNVLTSILRLDYMPLAHFQLTAKTHFINALDRHLATQTNGLPLGKSGNSTLVRVQLDAVLKF